MAPFAPGRGSKSAPRLVCRRSNVSAVPFFPCDLLQMLFSIFSKTASSFQIDLQNPQRFVISIRHGQDTTVWSAGFAASAAPCLRMTWCQMPGPEQMLVSRFCAWCGLIPFSLIFFSLMLLRTVVSWWTWRILRWTCELGTSWWIWSLAQPLVPGDQASTHGRSNEVQICWATVLTRSTSMGTFGTWLNLVPPLDRELAYQWPWVTTRGLCLGHFHNQCGGRPIQLQQPCQDLIFDGKMGVSWDGP